MYKYCTVNAINDAVCKLSRFHIDFQLFESEVDDYFLVFCLFEPFDQTDHRFPIGGYGFSTPLY